MEISKDIKSLFVWLPLTELEPNEGQLEGLPANPRKISESKLELLKVCFLSYSYIFFAKGREWDRQNLLIEFVVDLSQALTEKTEEGGDDE